MTPQPSRKDAIMSRSAHAQYTAADRYERRATRRQRACVESTRSAIAASLSEA